MRQLAVEKLGKMELLSQNEIVIYIIWNSSFCSLPLFLCCEEDREEGGFPAVGTREGVFVCSCSGFKVAMGIVTGRRCRRI